MRWVSAVGGYFIKNSKKHHRKRLDSGVLSGRTHVEARLLSWTWIGYECGVGSRPANTDCPSCLTDSSQFYHRCSCLFKMLERGPGSSQTINYEHHSSVSINCNTVRMCGVVYETVRF